MTQRPLQSGHLFIAIGAIALAAIASFHHDLAIDEPFTALAIAQPAALGTTLVHDDIPLYYVLLLGWTRIFGQSAFALRAMSMAAFGGAIVFSAAATRSVGGNRAGALAAVLVGCSVTFGLQPAATARPYALVMMFAAMAVWAALPDGRHAARLPLVAAHLLGLFTHPIFIFFSLASAAAAAVIENGRRLALMPLAAVAAYLAIWGARLARTAVLPATSWMSKPAWADVVAGLWYWGDHATPILGGVLLVLVAVRGTRAIRGYGEPLAFLFVLAALVLAGTIAASTVRPVYLASRTPVLVLPAIAVASGVLVAELAPLLVSCAVIALVFTSAVRFTVRSAEGPDPYPTRASLAAVAPRMRCGDTLVAAGLAYAPVVYYSAASGVPACVTIRAFPAAVGTHPGWLDLTPAARSSFAGEAASMTRSLGTAGTLWVFVPNRRIGADAGATLVAALSRARPRRESIAVSGSFFDEVIVFAAAAASPAGP